MKRLSKWTPGALGFFLGIACEGTGSTLELGYDQSSPWEYYREKYDADGNGVITAEEYDPERRVFAQLDRTGDALLTAEDFSAPGSDMRSMEIDMRAMRAMFEYLQQEGQQEAEQEELTMDELFFAAEEYDGNGDELLEEVEFRALADARYSPMPKDDMVRMMGEKDPWEALVDAIDTDANGALSFPELESFFDGLDDGDFILYFESEEALGGTSPREPQTGPRVGTPAPDFELLSPEGDGKIRLSGFAGKRPVALIFGSYT